MMFMERKRLIIRRYAVVAIVAVAVACTFLSGCRKEEKGMRFTIFTEPYRGGSKIVVDGLVSSWQTGDHIWVNDLQGSVSVVYGSPVMNVEVNSWDDYYYAAYPYSMVSSCTQAGLMSVTLPQAYQYREDASGHQLLELPMVARTVNERLTFKHLTGSLLVKVPATGTNVVLDYIMVKSSTSALSGTGTVDLSDDEPQVTFGADTTHTVVMYFDQCTASITSGKDIMIPVAPTSGDGHKFTVTVCAHSTGAPRKFYLFEKESNAGNLLRNEVAVAPVDELSEKTVPFLGNGDVLSPYLIQNKVDYKNFLYCLNADGVNDKYFSLTNDIDFGGETLTSVTLDHGFYGRFNGNGKHLSNVVVSGEEFNFHNSFCVSLFPAITGGEVRDLSVSDVRLLVPQSGYYYYIYAGGFTSYIQSASTGVVLENILVSDVEFGFESTNLTLKTLMAFGGIVGGLYENNSGYLSMVACRFDQPSLRTHIVSAKNNDYYMYVGGLIGNANGADVTLTNCGVGFGGNQNEVGTLVKTTCSYSYCGAAIGRTSNDSVQIETALLLEGHLQFVGDPYNNVKKMVGSSPKVRGKDLLSMDNLFVWKKLSMNGTNVQVTDTI